MSHQDSPELSASAAAPAPCLLSLPDDAILAVFAHLDNAHKLRLFRLRPCDATSLAAAHPRFGRLHRGTVVTQLEAPVICWTEAEERVLASNVQRQLRRCPRAGKLVLSFPPYDAEPVRLEAFLAAQLRVVEVANVMIHSGDIRGLRRACPGVVELGLRRCSWRVHQEEAKEELDDVEPQTLLQLQKLRLTEIDSELLHGLISSLTLVERHALRELDLYWCRNLYGSIEMLDACAALSNITKLSLQLTSFSCADATRNLPRLSSLRELDVSCTIAINDGALWAALPPTLVVLRANGTGQRWTGLFRDNGILPVRSEFALRVLEASKSGLRSWDALSSGFGELRELSLAYSGELGEDGVEAALAAMPQLEKLNLRGCDRVGDRTAAAIARHPRLSHSSIQRTAARWTPQRLAESILRQLGRGRAALHDLAQAA